MKNYEILKSNWKNPIDDDLFAYMLVQEYEIFIKYLPFKGAGHVPCIVLI